MHLELHNTSCQNIRTCHKNCLPSFRSKDNDRETKTWFDRTQRSLFVIGNVAPVDAARHSPSVEEENEKSQNVSICQMSPVRRIHVLLPLHFPLQRLSLGFSLMGTTKVNQLAHT